MPALNLKSIFFTGPIKWRALKKAGTALTVVLQVERKGEPAEQWTISPSTRLSY
jgi:hypothetical protein